MFVYATELYSLQKQPNLKLKTWSKQLLSYLLLPLVLPTVTSMEQRTLKNVNNGLNTNIYSYLETSGGHSYNLYLNVVHFFNASLN
jgi:hypothetical protein